MKNDPQYIIDKAIDECELLNASLHHHKAQLLNNASDSACIAEGLLRRTKKMAGAVRNLRLLLLSIRSKENKND